MKSRITPCLWFDTRAEDAAKFYTSIFPNSKITAISRYPEAGREVHGKPPGSVMTVAFELDGHCFTALNGGPRFTFDEAISFQVNCGTQDEIDHYWNALGDEGGKPGPCGWLEDKFGVSWQIVPTALPKLLGGDDREGAQRTMHALLKMGKLDIAELQRAHDGS